MLDPNGRRGETAYGLLPHNLFEALRRGILARQQAERISAQRR